MPEPTPIAARYADVSTDGDKNPDWMLIRDRATSKVILVHCADREECLRVLRALNFADAHDDRVEEDAA